MQPWHFFITGGVLVVMGVILPFLMLMRLLPVTFFWNILAYVASFIGLLLGILGSAMYVAKKKHGQ